ncbi:hypothetical protein V5799_013084 [Amblyomma americanum]|uniref:THAP-type domain-containing protein n=1 Tax=Amblyomma americanum TaxID=6943 RepID=A0AAQ4E6Z2_AMBAM
MASASSSSQKPRSHYCCVVECHKSLHNTKNREPPVKFYRFPVKWYEKERCQVWISAVCRINPDGTTWKPNASSIICSDHFVGNSKSDISHHSSYVPSMFPSVYKKKMPNQERSKGWLKRFKQAASSPEEADVSQQQQQQVVVRLHSYICC